MTTDTETAETTEKHRRERFENLFNQCLAISVREDRNNREWFSIAWGRATEITTLYDAQMLLPAQPPPALAAGAPLPPSPVQPALPADSVVSTPDFTMQPGAGPGGTAPMLSPDYQTAPAVPGAPPAAPPTEAPAKPDAPATVFGPQFQGWPPVELEAILHAAQAWSLCRENNGTPEQFEEVLKDVTTALDALAQRRIAMMLEKKSQG